MVVGLSIRPNNIEPGGIQGGNACMDLPRIPPAVVRIFRTRRRGDIPSECLTLPYFSRAVNQPMQSSHTSIYITVALKPCRCHTCHDLTFGDAIFLPSPVLRVSTLNTCSYPEKVTRQPLITIMVLTLSPSTPCNAGESAARKRRCAELEVNPPTLLLALNHT